MIVCLILLLGLVCCEPVTASPQPKDPLKTREQMLLQVQTQIEKLAKKDLFLDMRFNRLAQILFEGQEQEIAISEVEMIPSIGIPYKDNFYYTMMVRKKSNYYSLKGDLIYAGKKNSSFALSARNQYTYFAQLNNTQLAFYRCRVANKKTIVELQNTIQLKRHTNINVNYVFIAHHSSNKHFIVVDARGHIIILDRQNNTLKEINTKYPIVQTQKVNHNFVVLTLNQLVFFNLNKNASKVDCVLPQGSIDYFKFQDYNFRYIYGVKQGMMYQFQLANQCKIVKTFHIPLNSSIQIANQLAFILANARHYALNLTTGQLKPYKQPMSPCQGEQKLSVIRKIQTSYINSRICLKENKISINLVSFDLQNEQSSGADFSKFRIPLLLLSFGVIVYMSVKNKKKQKTQEQSQEQIRHRLFDQYPQLREVASKGMIPENMAEVSGRNSKPEEPVERKTSNVKNKSN